MNAQQASARLIRTAATVHPVDDGKAESLQFEGAQQDRALRNAHPVAVDSATHRSALSPAGMSEWDRPAADRSQNALSGPVTPLVHGLTALWNSGEAMPPPIPATRSPRAFVEEHFPREA